MATGGPCVNENLRQCFGVSPDVRVPTQGFFQFFAFVRGVVIWRAALPPWCAKHRMLLPLLGFNLSHSLVAGCSLWWLPRLLTCRSPLNGSVSKAGGMVLFHTDAGFTEPLGWHFPHKFCALHHYRDDWVCQGMEEKRSLGPLLGVPQDKLLKFLSTLDFPALFEEWFGAGGGEPSSWTF